MRLAAQRPSATAFWLTWSASNRRENAKRTQKLQTLNPKPQILMHKQSVEGATASERERFSAKLKALEGDV